MNHQVPKNKEEQLIEQFWSMFHKAVFPANFSDQELEVAKTLFFYGMHSYKTAIKQVNCCLSHMLENSKRIDSELDEFIKKKSDESKEKIRNN